MAFEFCVWEKSSLYEWILQVDLSAYKKRFWKLEDDYSAGFEILVKDSSLLIGPLKNVPSVSSAVHFFSVFLGIPTEPVSAAVLHRVLLKKTQNKT